jgi:hypothetical protein
LKSCIKTTQLELCKKSGEHTQAVVSLALLSIPATSQ